MAARIVDEMPFGFGWVEGGSLRRTAHALRAGGRVWLVDPFEAPGVEERVRALGEPAGVIQLLDRHERDCPAFAARLGVPYLRVPDAAPPFEFVRILDSRLWRERALWWPERRVLVAADAIGTSPFFLASGERAAVHPFLRLRPPRALLALAPEHLLVGHGEGVHGPDAAAALREAIEGARRGAPRWLASLPRRLREVGRRDGR
jgi:hypothetical protein